MTDAEDHGLGRRFGLITLLFTVLFGLLMGRFFWLQIVRGDEYRERARVSFTTKERLPARRGELRDRNGQVLARNVAHHKATILPRAVRDPEVRGATLDRLSTFLLLTREERAAIEQEIVAQLEANNAWQPVEVRDDLVAATCPHDGTVLTLDADAATHAPLLFCHACGRSHEGIASDARQCPHDKRKLDWATTDGERHAATCPRCERSFVTAPICPDDGELLTPVHHNLSCPACKRRFSDQVAILRAHKHELPGVRLDTYFMRDYPQPFLASHLLGYMNLVTAEDREAEPGVYALSARVGRAGAERAFEAILRGVAGEAEYYKGAEAGLTRAFRAAEPGHDVWLTLDARLQREVRQAMRYQRSGAAVVLEPRTGEILAMYSTPGFDPNEWSGRLTREAWDELAKNPYDPMLNKALTPYAPGSVYKIVTSLAILHDGLMTPEDTIHCPGYYEFAGRRFRCHQRTGHGFMNLVNALKYSCDVYYYRLGERLGMDRLAHFGHLFGFGEPTGIEVAERTGLVPTRAYHTDTPLGFQPGFTLSTSIGQGSLTASPLQVARSFAAIANGGNLVETRVLKQITDERGVVVERFLPVEGPRLPMTPEQREIIHEGLVRTVNDPDGTGGEARLDSVLVAGKTGTAEAPMSRPGADPELARWLLEDHAWFAAYAPAHDPQVVVVVYLEHGGSGGKKAGPLVKQILQAWMRLGLYRVADPAPSVAPGGGG